MNRQVWPVLKLLCTGLVACCISACAAHKPPAQAIAADLYTVKQQFAAGQHLQSMQGCLAIISRKPDCAALDQGLYYGALNSLRLPEDRGGGKAQAAEYLMRILTDCPGSPYRPEAEVWLSVVKAVPDKEAAALIAVPGQRLDMDQLLKKKDQEIKRLKSETARLNREIDQLKKVDVQEYKQKKDLDNGPDERKDTRP